jgi:hypothetical protein
MSFPVFQQGRRWGAYMRSSDRTNWLTSRDLLPALTMADVSNHNYYTDIMKPSGRRFREDGAAYVLRYEVDCLSYRNDVGSVLRDNRFTSCCSVIASCTSGLSRFANRINSSFARS